MHSTNNSNLFKYKLTSQNYFNLYIFITILKDKYFEYTSLMSHKF